MDMGQKEECKNENNSDSEDEDMDQVGNEAEGDPLTSKPAFKALLISVLVDN